MVSKDYVICPYCKNKHSKTKAIGTSGIVCYTGSQLIAKCDKCGKDFEIEYDVKFTFRTRKED